jgi:hypothetical protein
MPYPASFFRLSMVRQEAVAKVGQRERLAPHRDPARPAGGQRQSVPFNLVLPLSQLSRQLLKFLSRNHRCQRVVVRKR